MGALLPVSLPAAAAAAVLPASQALALPAPPLTASSSSAVVPIQALSTTHTPGLTAKELWRALLATEEGQEMMRQTRAREAVQSRKRRQELEVPVENDSDEDEEELPRPKVRPISAFFTLSSRARLTLSFRTSQGRQGAWTRGCNSADDCTCARCQGKSLQIKLLVRTDTFDSGITQRSSQAPLATWESISSSWEAWACFYMRCLPGCSCESSRMLTSLH
jgi:hypothetical protein